MSAAVMPIPLGEARQMNRDEFLEITENMNIAKGADMVERQLLLLVQEVQILGLEP